MHTSHVSAKRLHPFEGFATVITDKVFALRVDGLVSIQRTCCDKGLPAYLTSVWPLSRVRPDMSCKVAAVIETLFADRAAVGLLSALLAVAAVVTVAGVERQSGVLQTAPQTGRRRHEVFYV